MALQLPLSAGLARGRATGLVGSLGTPWPYGTDPLWEYVNAMYMVPVTPDGQLPVDQTGYDWLAGAGAVGSKVVNGEYVNNDGSSLFLASPGRAPNWAGFSGNFCVEGFYKYSSATANFEDFFGSYWVGGNHKVFQVYRNGTNTYLNLSLNGSSNVTQGLGGDGFPPANVYAHVAFVHHNGVNIWYVNGVNTGTRSYGPLHDGVAAIYTESRGSWGGWRVTTGHSRYGNVSSFNAPTINVGFGRGA